MSQNKKIKITCDSTCDLPEELYKKYDVEVIPLGVLLGDDLRHDGVDVKVSELYDYVAKTGILPKTSAIPVVDYKERWGKYLSEGCAVIHINISSEISACYQNAVIAAEESEGEVYPIDSRLLSSGSGMLIIAAAHYISEGLSAKETADTLNALKSKVDCSFVIQTLEYLKKGGRCSSLEAFGANLLNLHPEINMENGVMSVGRKYRGGPEKFITSYIKDRLDGRTDAIRSLSLVTHSKADPEVVKKVMKTLKEDYGFETVIETLAGSTISSHCGAGTLGIMFFKK